MTTFHKILCPIDCSDGSRVALDYALSVSEKFGSEIHALHAWHVDHHYVRPDLTVWLEAQGQQPIGTMIAAEARAETDKFIAGLDASVRAKLQVHLAEGDAWRAIVDHAKAGKFDLIVMGTHGRTGVVHLALGSVAERVVRHAPCPVLTVRVPS